MPVLYTRDPLQLDEQDLVDYLKKEVGNIIIFTPYTTLDSVIQVFTTSPNDHCSEWYEYTSDGAITYMGPDMKEPIPIMDDVNIKKSIEESLASIKYGESTCGNPPGPYSTLFKTTSDEVTKKKTSIIINTSSDSEIVEYLNYTSVPNNSVIIMPFELNTLKFHPYPDNHLTMVTNTGSGYEIIIEGQKLPVNTKKDANKVLTYALRKYPGFNVVKTDINELKNTNVFSLGSRPTYIRNIVIVVGFITVIAFFGYFFFLRKKKR